MPQTSLPVIRAQQPQAVAAERALLGALLLNNAALAAIDDKGLRTFHFFDSRHFPIYDSIVHLINHRGECDSVLLLQHLAETDEMGAAGGNDYIDGLTNIAAAVQNIGVYADEILRTAHLRRAHIILAAAQSKVLHPGRLTPQSIAEEVAEKLIDVAISSGGGKIIKFADISNDKFTDPDIVTGIGDLDFRLEGGLRAGDIYTIGGASGAGKTSLSAQIAAKANSALVIANDMSPRHWHKLLLEQNLGAPPRAQFSFLTDTRTALDIAACARAWSRTAPRPQTIIVDMTQSLPPGNNATAANATKADQISEVMSIIRRIAEVTQAIIILNCALVKNADAHKPDVEDLRDGGDLVYKSDTILLLGDLRDNNDSGLRKLIIGKNRWGRFRGNPITLSLGNNRKFAAIA